MTPYEDSVVYSEPIPYPSPVLKEGHTFTGWDVDYDRMPARDLTITALWDINNYTLTFVFNNNDEPDEETLEYDENITYPEDPERERGVHLRRVGQE